MNSSPPSPTRPLRSRVNPYVVAFVFGAIFLTFVPKLQRRFLHAPAPLGPIGSYSLRTLNGTPVTDRSVRGQLLLLQLLPRPCDTACRERVEAMGRMGEQFGRYRTAVRLGSLLRPSGPDASLPEDLAGGQGSAGELWLTGDGAEVREVVGRLDQLFARWAQVKPESAAAAMPKLALVDQNGEVRGFWRDDPAGRGNAINAALLLARYGTRP